jgi:hypothetical protein
MSLRFLKKRDGSKVLQQSGMVGGGWSDVPMVEERSVKDELLLSVANFKRCYRLGAPEGIILGKKDYDLLEQEMHRYSLYPERGYSTIQIEGVPVTKHQTKLEGVYFIIEAR